MANILLTERCNLKCSYCFAVDYTSKHANEIAFEDFKKAVAFIMCDNPNQKLGIIGGEPTLYSRFGDVLDFLESEEKVKHAVIFTNGIRLGLYKEQIRSKKLVFLINSNDPREVGPENHKEMTENIRWLVEERHLKNNILLGLNIYKKNMDVTYFCDLLKEFGFQFARISVVVPNDMEKYRNALEYFIEMKETVLSIFEKLAKVNVLPKYDCNKIPACVWTEEEKKRIQHLFGKRLELSNILNQTVTCKPTVDIDTELNVIRCFGFSGEHKVRMADYKNLEDLTNYFINAIDARYKKLECPVKICRTEKKNSCLGGCMAFKRKEIL